MHSWSQFGRHKSRSISALQTTLGSLDSEEYTLAENFPYIGMERSFSYESELLPKSPTKEILLNTTGK